MRKTTVFGLVLSSILTGFVFAKKFWGEKAFTEWTREEAFQMISRSPWSKEQTINFLSDNPMDRREDVPAPPPTPGDPDNPAGNAPPSRLPQVDVGMRGQPVLITWIADPVRKAFARLTQLERGLSNEEVEKSLPASPEVIQFTLRGRALVRLLDKEGSGIENAFLKKKNGQQIPVKNVNFSKDGDGSPLIVLEFPLVVNEKPIVTLEDQEVQLIVKIGKHKIDPKFKLKDMLIQGSLML